MAVTDAPAPDARSASGPGPAATATILGVGGRAARTSASREKRSNTGTSSAVYASAIRVHGSGVASGFPGAASWPVVIGADLLSGMATVRHSDVLILPMNHPCAEENHDCWMPG